MSVLERLGELTAHGAPAPRERQKAEAHLTDLIGAWVAAGDCDEAAAIQRLGATAGRLRLTGEGPLDELVRRVAVARSSEIDDIHMRSCATMGAVVIPTLLAFAEQGDFEPERLAGAVCAGYEVAIRIGIAIGGARILYRGVWPSYFLAPIAAAATASRLFRLDSHACANALALALNRAPVSIGAPADHLARFLLAGMAARAGVEAALAAADGVGADLSLLDGDWLTRVHGITLEPVAIAESFQAMSELSMKPFCAAKQTIASIDGFLQLLGTDVEPDKIAAVRVFVPPPLVKMIAHRNCAERSGRITSLPYQLALAALRPSFLSEVKRTNMSGDPSIAAFMTRVTVLGDEDLLERFPGHWPAKVQISLADGSEKSICVIAADGDPERAFDDGRQETKFKNLVEPALGAESASDLLSACRLALSSGAAMKRLGEMVDVLSARERARALNGNGERH